MDECGIVDPMLDECGARRVYAQEAHHAAGA